MLDQREDEGNAVPHARDDGEHEREREEMSRALSITDNDGSTGLVLPDAEVDYTQLFARLQMVIDNATQTIRDLRRENAALSSQLSQYDARPQMQAENVGKAAELHQAATHREELLEPESLITAEAEARPLPTPPHRVVAPVPPVPEARYDASTNGVVPAWDTPREMPPASEPVYRPALPQMQHPTTTGTPFAGTYTLVVYPFTRFSDLGQFQSALHAFAGIHDVQVRRFAQGTLEMRLTYNGASPLTQALRDLPVRVQDVDEEEPYRLRVRLDLHNDS